VEIAEGSRLTSLQIKYFRIADTILDQAMDDQEKSRALNRQRGGGRGMSFLFLHAIYFLTRTLGGRGGPGARGGEVLELFRRIKADTP
jgi:hypothetical protein